MRAQAEMIVIVGIIVLAIVALFFSYQQLLPTPDPVPTGIAQQQQQVRDSFLVLSKNGADRVIEIMEIHGGALSPEVIDNDPQFPSQETFRGHGVTYWHACENDLSLSKGFMEEQMARGIEHHILNNVEELQQSFDMDVHFDISQLDVTANILDNKIDYAIDLPTQVSGYAVAQPYQLSVPTNFGRITSFARDYAAAAAEERFMDWHTIASIRLSRTLPTVGLLTSCGQTIYLTPDEVSQGLEGAIRHTLTNTLWWQNMPVDQVQPKVYAIQHLNGNTYPELDLRFALTDDFGITTLSPILITNHEILVNGPFMFQIPVCVSTYNQKYDLAYPYVLSVDDDVTGHTFSFASLVHIEDQGGDDSMEPGSCTLPANPAEVCADTGCTADFVVRDGDGNTLDGVQATFGGCRVGTSDENGRVQGPIVCGTHDLLLFHSASYSHYLNPETADLGGTYTLQEIPEATWHFREVRITRPSYHRCSVSPPNTNDNVYTYMRLEPRYSVINIDPDSFELPDDPTVCQDTPAACLGFTVLESLTTGYIPSGGYDADAELRDPEDGKIKGAFLTPWMLPSQDEDHYVYVPRTADAFDLRDWEKRQLTTSLATSCDMLPLTDEIYPDRTYKFANHCKCVELRDIASELVGTCLTQEEVNAMFFHSGDDDDDEDPWRCTKSAVVSTINQVCQGDARIVGACA